MLKTRTTRSVGVKIKQSLLGVLIINGVKYLRSYCSVCNVHRLQSTHVFRLGVGLLLQAQHVSVRSRPLARTIRSPMLTIAIVSHRVWVVVVEE